MKNIDFKRLPSPIARYRDEVRSRVGDELPDHVTGWYNQIARAQAEARETERRAITDQEIVERAIYSMINEGAKILEEGIAARPLDIDAVWLYGYGFPVYLGGPMFYADTVGLKKVYEAIVKYRDMIGAEYWTPSPLLEKLAKEGKGFYSK